MTDQQTQTGARDCARCKALAPQLCGEHIRIDARRRMKGKARGAAIEAKLKGELSKHLQNMHETRATALAAHARGVRKVRDATDAAIKGGKLPNGEAFPWKLGVHMLVTAAEMGVYVDGDDGETRAELAADLQRIALRIGTDTAQTLLSGIDRTAQRLQLD